MAWVFLVRIFCRKMDGSLIHTRQEEIAMAKLIPAADRILRARSLIQQARDLPIPADLGHNDFHYIAQVKDLLRQAKDMVKFISMTPTATPAMKAEVQAIYAEIEQADGEILHPLQ